jgi:peptidoglycan-N-acetylglucosamine deacetylase
MKRMSWRTAVLFTLSLPVALICSGCTLTGASPAPPETIEPTVGISGITQQPPPATPTVPLVIGTPTPAATVDAFGTLTAMAQNNAGTGTPSLGVVTPTVGAVVTQAAAGITSTPGAASGSCPANYTVQTGDNLFRIALKFNLTVAQLATANGIANPEFIVVGTVLKIPSCTGSVPATTGGATGTPTGGGAGTTTGLKPVTGDTVDTNGDILHTVKSGENLFRIALTYGMSWQKVATYNGITDGNAIVVGQVIRIPTK